MVTTVPFVDIQVAVPGFGAMGMSQSYGAADDEESLKTLAKAVELGCTFWDSAAIYGSGHNERLIGRFFKENEGAREKVFIASKCGIEFTADGPTGRIDNSAQHIKSYLQASTERLGTVPDLYYIHRIEPGRDLTESIGALDEARKAGKCRYIGLSECSAETLRKACSIAKIDALQIEYSPWFTDPEQNGLIDTAKEFGVKVIAYSPLGKGVLTGQFTKPSDFAEGDIRKTIPRFQEKHMESNLRIVREFEVLAKKKGCTSGQMALAWVISQGAIPIPGTRSSTRLEENFGATDVTLDEEDLKALRQLVEEAKPQGARYNEAQLKLVGR
ncbi:hypothetical protein FFLO_01704 [Filobasidium floriforme]|uniref:NADP-dependent oxidoreductase domain-containing protein n=1 Tax=Filobasidium floriforme TaxID=5210 RepID=A0A8K0JP47_9TREE|nr:NADP-dependent oxidoreductase domain-containing protein [Filobasidium floriforme]KAG7562875.1 hypothetical protein FFLO_01704 [Filobasidium floriforme]KAH8086435.1 NADP-dependent oxidoreductase domain-containing protein [Filobasidium floriforme]